MPHSLLSEGTRVKICRRGSPYYAQLGVVGTVLLGRRPGVVAPFVAVKLDGGLRMIFERASVQPVEAVEPVEPVEPVVRLPYKDD